MNNFSTIDSFPEVYDSASISLSQRVVEISDTERPLADLTVQEYIQLNNHHIQSHEKTWNSQKEIMLKKWGEEAYGYAWMHHECIDYYNKWDKALWIPSIVFGVMFAGTGIATLGLNLPLTIALITYIGTGVGTTLSGIHSQMKFSKRVQEHMMAEIGYRDFHNHISEELAKDKKDRHSADEFITWARRKIRDLSNPDQSPSIPKKIIKRYVKHVKDKNIYLPAIAGGSGEILL